MHPRLYQKGLGLFFEFLLELATLATQPAQIAQVGAANLGVPFHYDLIDERRAQQESTFHADTVSGHAANRKIAAVASLANTDHGTFEFLDALAIAFFDLDVNANLVTRA
jgi:hypothetical protein